MYHSITFGDKNSYDDWFLVPTSRPVFNPPAPKTTVIDLPGADSSLDLSQSLTGYPVYNNRQGSIEFLVLNDKMDWADLYSEIANYLHGRTLRAVLEDDPDWMYEGRFTINNWKSNNNGTWSNITIDYDVKPYKMSVQESTDGWLWDPFSFYEGVIQDTFFSSIVVNSDSYITKNFTGLINARPIVPIITVNVTSGSYITLALYNSDTSSKWIEKNFKTGTYQEFDFVMCELTKSSVVKMRMKGHGTVSIKFRSGRL